MVYKRGRYYWAKFKWKGKLVRMSTRCEDYHDAKNAEKIIRSRLAEEHAREIPLRPWRYPASKSYLDWIADQGAKYVRDSMFLDDVKYLVEPEFKDEKRKAQHRGLQVRELRATIHRHLKLGLYDTALATGEKLLELQNTEENRVLIRVLRTRTMGKI